MNTVTLTQNEAIAAGGIIGGIFATAGIFILAVYILLIVAWWKIFTKAGEAGWKSIIPIYNIYIFASSASTSGFTPLVSPLFSPFFTP